MFLIKIVLLGLWFATLSGNHLASLLKHSNPIPFKDIGKLLENYFRYRKNKQVLSINKMRIFTTAAERKAFSAAALLSFSCGSPLGVLS